MGNRDSSIITCWLLAFVLQLVMVGLPYGFAARAAQGVAAGEYNRLSRPDVQITPGAAYIIGLGDVLEVVVWKEPDLSRTVKVRTDGRISVPLIGDVVAAGKSPEELSETLKKKLSEIIEEPAVSVILTENKSSRYYIIGKVSQPGEYFIDFPITVLQAIGRAGGFVEWAKTSDIAIVRRKTAKEEILKFDYDSLIKHRDMQQNVFVEPGDTIVVP